MNKRLNPEPTPLEEKLRYHRRLGHIVPPRKSAGIPARQIYTPRWSHCDDNHAWVEVYIRGSWYFLGACEPEEVLNKGWFAAPASRAILIHSRAFSDFSADGQHINQLLKAYTMFEKDDEYVVIDGQVKIVDEQTGRIMEGRRYRCV